VIEEHRNRIDDRTIGLFSFQTVINCWARFLDSRYANAKMNLIDPLDSLDGLEAVVVPLEKGVETLETQFHRSNLEAFRAQVTDAELSLEALVRSNGARCLQLGSRKLYVSNRLSVLPKDPNLVISFPPQLPIEPINIAELGDLESRISKDLYGTIKARQDRLNELEIEVRLAEDQLRSVFGEEVVTARLQAEKMGSVQEFFHLRTELEREIAESEERNGRLKMKLWKIEDSDCSDRQTVVRNEKLRERTNMHQQEIAEAETKIRELEQEGRLKSRGFVEQRKALMAGVEKLKSAEEAKKDLEAEVVQLEQQVVELEFRLNLKLKEVASLSGYVPPAEIFTEKSGISPRIEEIQQVVSLVTVDREV
jgi:hypothetical protein